jgi:catechol 2,3-dioxygenase-like lactoylglutathione lyase family enzyme
MTSTGNRLSLADRNGLKAPFAALHHVALVTNDMEATVRFYRDVLGSEIAMAHRQGERDVRHYFITVAPNTVFAFFEFPEAEMPEWQEATRPKSGRHLDHVDFYVESIDDVRRWEQRLTEHNVPIKRTIGGDSIFFHDPNNIVIQLSVGPTDKEPWPILDDPDPAY